VAIQGLSINIADGSVYPASVKLHDNVVDSIAHLWNCPKPETQGEESEHFAGAGTVGKLYIYIYICVCVCVCMYVCVCFKGVKRE
jgi:glutamate/tyrosine decarboxylase-like PLP-dependent enzyme